MVTVQLTVEQLGVDRNGFVGLDHPLKHLILGFWQLVGLGDLHQCAQVERDSDKIPEPCGSPRGVEDADSVLSPHGLCYGHLLVLGQWQHDDAPSRDRDVDRCPTAAHNDVEQWKVTLQSREFRDQAAARSNGHLVPAIEQQR